MEVIGNEHPGVECRSGILYEFRKALDKSLTVFVVLEDTAPLDPTYDDVVQRALDIETGLAGHS
jgi:hypothetical protein